MTPLGRLSLILFGAACAWQPACAWGPEGHAIIAEIAEARLTPAARQAVVSLLSPQSHQHLDEIASWADAYHAVHPETGPWHFVDIPLDAAGYDAARDCPQNDCVVGRLDEIAPALGDRQASPADRLAALEFTVHFVGDIHQPLHAADNHDRGGNDLTLTYDGRPTNLHAVWDLGLIERELQTKLGPNWTPDLAVTRAEAARLDADITPAEAATWAPARMAARLPATTVAWANESHALAKSAYRDLPEDRSAGWEDGYDRLEWPVVQRQLQRAGVRLAAVLNAELAGG